MQDFLNQLKYFHNVFAMIALSYITNSLDELDKLYNKATSKKQAIYYSKLATLELCGWVEDTVDDIILMHSNRKLKESPNRTYIKKDVIQRTFGFQYKQHIRPMLIAVLGIITIEKIERKFEKNGSITMLRNSLGNLKKSRDKAAHTHLKGAMSSYDAPSIIKNEFKKIKTVLIELDSELRSM